MKLSRKGEYACLALIHLGRNYNIKLVNASEISEENDIPKRYLEQILSLLKGTGYVRAVRGISGGYKLSKAPEEITLAEIIRLMDGALAPVESVSEYFYENSPIEQNQNLVKVFRDIRDYISEKLENTTIKDLI
ncbi:MULTISPECIES: RrF2 family transcriptional regulator [Clostridium]|uniref:Transcriptional regulator, BadM/Rrf2 family protein n=2 Tax=Clostridium intestinale TaxID=36845 RepID=U2Q2K3_9CLOT|nr:MULTISPECIES: Rrf2 family transcriptional regulator [Clostridium]ERK30304.1 transcriptional regulator, BadM/Rrf2 family protein [Clostridium intestinale URNW]QLY78236.1 Rrf2 family transcriptional regulator [Clostridium intestinale]